MNKALIRQLNYGHLEFDTMDRSFLKQRSFISIIIRAFLKVAKYLIEDLKNFKFFPKFDQNIVFVSRSINNELAMSPIFDALNADKKFYGHYTKKHQDQFYLPKFIPSFISLLYLPKAFLFYFQLSDQDKKNIRYGDTDLFFTYGFYFFFRRLFKKYDPQALIISNNEFYITRILIHLGNQKNIPTFYVSHACASDYFPKFSETKVLIYGQDTREKYIKAGIDAEKLVEVGMPKADNWVDKVNDKTNVETIGYAINGLEDMTEIVKEITSLRETFPHLSVIFRPHPMLYYRAYYKKLIPIVDTLTALGNVKISNPRQESPFAFITEIDLLIAGESSIHLEAIMLNVYSIYYDNKKKFVDHYGFLEKGLIPKTQNFNEVINIIKSVEKVRPYIRNKAQYYITTINTPNDGKATQLAVKAIEDTITSFK